MKLYTIEGWVQIVGVRPGVSRGNSWLSEVDQVFHWQVVRPMFLVYEFPRDNLGQSWLKASSFPPELSHCVCEGIEII